MKLFKQVGVKRVFSCWQRLVLIVLGRIGPRMSCMVGIGPRMSCMVGIGPRMSFMVRIGPHMSCMVGIGPHMSCMVGIGPLLVINNIYCIMYT